MTVEKRSETETFDCVVVGVGGIGSAALLASARRGWKTLGIERFGLAHTCGSSHGQSRIIRRAYYEHPSYVPLTELSFEAWKEIDRACPKRLLEITGLLQVGPPQGEIIQGVLESARTHNLAVDEITPAEIGERFPIFKINPQHTGVFESGAGLLRVEWCVAQMAKMAMEFGAEIQTETIVKSFKSLGQEQILIETDKGPVHAKKVIVASGAWSSQLLAGLNLKLEVLRKQQHWFQLDRIDNKMQNGMPAFLFETDRGCYYGLPEIDYLGMKIAEHSGGVPVPDPTHVDRMVDTEELKRNEHFLDSHFHFSRRRLVHSSVCMYTESVDKHFILDLHPEMPDIAIATGFSGHGFKFAPVIGEHLVRMLDQGNGNRVREESEIWRLFEFLRLGHRDLQTSAASQDHENSVKAQFDA